MYPLVIGEVQLQAAERLSVIIIAGVKLVVAKLTDRRGCKVVDESCCLASTWIRYTRIENALLVAGERQIKPDLAMRSGGNAQLLDPVGPRRRLLEVIHGIGLLYDQSVRAPPEEPIEVGFGRGCPISARPNCVMMIIRPDGLDGCRHQVCGGVEMVLLFSGAHLSKMIFRPRSSIAPTTWRIVIPSSGGRF